MKEISFEQQLFDWDGWDEAGDTGDIQFYKCKLKKDFHQFKKGQLFDWAFLSLTSSLLEFSLDGESDTYKFKLNLDTLTTKAID